MSPIDFALGAAAALGLGKAAAGAAALAMLGELAATNAAGIPRWVPHGLSLALAVASVLCWRPRVAQGVLCAFWATVAGAFARPAILAAGWPDIRPELVLLPVLAVVAGLLAAAPYPTHHRIALLAAPAALAVAVGTLAAGFHAAVDALALAAILGLAGQAVASAYILRRHA